MRFSELLQKAVEAGASDVIVTVGSPPVLRRNGELVRCDGAAFGPGDTELLVHQILNEEQRRRFEQNGEVNISYSIFGTGRFRVSAFRQRGTVGIVARIIPSVLRTGVQLGIPDAVINFGLAPGGLILIAGPPGSGRTTTIAAMIDAINTQRAAHIVSLEDPVEYLFRHKLGIVHQREIGADTASFGSGLAAAIVQSADVVVISDLQPEVIPLAFEAASGRVLIIAAVVARSIREALAGIVNRFPVHAQEQAAYRLAWVLRGASCQQLLRRSGGEGVVPAFEVLAVGQDARQAILASQWDRISQLTAEGAEPGSTSMHDSLVKLLAAGDIDHAQYTEAAPLV